MNICIRPKEINVSHYGEKCIKTYFQDVTKKVLCSYKSFQKQPPEVLQKKVLKNVAKSTGKHLCQSLIFNKAAGLRPATLLKKGLWHMCFPVNFAKFLRTTSFLQNSSGRLLLHRTFSTYLSLLLYRIFYYLFYFLTFFSFLLP